MHTPGRKDRREYSVVVSSELNTELTQRVGSIKIPFSIFHFPFCIFVLHDIILFIITREPALALRDHKFSPLLG